MIYYPFAEMSFKSNPFFFLNDFGSLGGQHEVVVSALAISLGMGGTTTDAVNRFNALTTKSSC
jgi:hypothetical protein